MMTIDQFRETLEAGPYAWPGGYPRYFIMADGEALSFAAAVECRPQIEDSLRGINPDNNWTPMAVDINWEDTALVCAHTGKAIESAYGESV
jgi:hypothetical protein